MLVYSPHKETVITIMMLYKNTKAMILSPNGDADFFDIVAGVLQGNTLATYLLIICLDYVLRTSIDQIKENIFTLKKTRSRWYIAETMTDEDYTDCIVWNQHQEVLASTWSQIKPSSCILTKKVSSQL